jgi:hypothetical protein
LSQKNIEGGQNHPAAEFFARNLKYLIKPCYLNYFAQGISIE